VTMSYGAKHIAMLERKIAELEREAHIDHLTQVYNRRAFEIRLIEAVSFARRNQSPLSLAVIDIDNFKLRNDTFGHSAGDRCLRGLAGLLKARCRKEDTVARMGGEEFALIMPGIGEGGAIEALERIAKELRGVDLPGGVMTFSAGVADVELDPLELYEAADQAMYEVKHNGKNRVAGAVGSMRVR
jgi:diguanylate cyclase (GGDEF)-like protein